MTNYNKVIQMGRLTRDVDLRHTQGGTTVAKTGFAVNRWRGADKDDDVCFINLVAFGKTAELLAKHYHKGSAIHFEGRISYSVWQDQDGQKRSAHELVVESLQFLPRKSDKGAGGGDAAAPTGDYSDIPF